MFRRLLLLNGLAASAVPIHHAAAYGLLAMFQWTDRYQPVTVPDFSQLGSPPYFVLITIRQLVTFAVPVFLFVSGFYMAFLGKSQRTPLNWSVLSKRMQILAIPFLIWTAVRYVLLRRPPSSINDVLDPYFYIPLLLQFYLLSPWSIRVAEKHWKLLLGVAGALQFWYLAVKYLQIFGVQTAFLDQLLSAPRWLFIRDPLWFPLGIVFGLHLEEARPILAKLRVHLVGATIVLCLLMLAEYQVVDQLSGEDWLGPTFGGVFRIFYSLAVILAVLAFESGSSRSERVISQIGYRSLGIYMANIPFIYGTALLLYHLAPSTLGTEAIYVPSLIIAGMGGPLLLMKFVNSSPARGAYRSLFG